MEMDGEKYYLKAMNCPMHNLIFRSRGRSYRELPMRLFEFGSVYRYEKSGVIHGLTRVRGMTQDDSHIYCTREQMRDLISRVQAWVQSITPTVYGDQVQFDVDAVMRAFATTAGKQPFTTVDFAKLFTHWNDPF